jgi:hypothetical protein
MRIKVLLGDIAMLKLKLADSEKQFVEIRQQATA